MSKSLYINNKKVSIDSEKTYFPFSYKISDLDNLEIIGVPVSKDIEIPRIDNNDEIFGYLGNINRNTISSVDGLISISFNQIRKGYYKLYNESELISEGLVTVNDITNSSYNISLLDMLIDKVEKLENINLNEIKLVNTNNTFLTSFTNDANTISNLNETTLLTPTFNIKKYEEEGTTLRCNVSDKMETFELDQTVSPLQLRSVKVNDINYAIKLKDIIKGINSINLDDSINPNLLGESHHLGFSPNDTHLGTSSIQYDGDEYYMKATPDLGYWTSLFGAYSYRGSNKYYIDSMWVKQNSGLNQPLTIYNTVDYNESVKIYNLPSDEWVRISTNPYQIQTESNGYIIVIMDNINVPLDYKKIKIEQTQYLTDWIPNVNDSSFYNFKNITIDNKLNTVFDEVRLLSNTPKKLTVDSYTNNIDAITIGSANPVSSDFKSALKINSSNIVKKNGNYYLRLRIKSTFDCSAKRTKILTTNKNDNIQYDINTLSNTTIGSFYLSFYLSGYNTTEKYRSTVVKTRLELIKDNTLTYDLNPSGFIKNIYLNCEVEFKIDYYPLFSTTDSVTYLNIIWKDLIEDTFLNVPYSDYRLYGNWSIPEGKIVYTSLPVKTGDTLNSENILPKVSIKDFIINTCKFFNFGIKVFNNSIYIFKKQYNMTSELLKIDENSTSVQTKLIDASSIIFSTKVPESDLMKKYTEETKKIYGEQIIKTGYSIKKNDKKIEYNVIVPFLTTDVNNFAYNSFTNYLNAGYCKVNQGVVEGNNDKLVFGYLQKNKETMYICNDTLFEAGMTEIINNVAVTPEETKFTIANDSIKYNSTTKKFYYTEPLGIQSKKIDNYYTFSPYLFENEKIVKSLEFNKPTYTYTKNISDENYPINSTLYYRFHKKMTEDKLNVNTHLLKCNMFLDGYPNVNNIYNYKNNNYIISNLPEFDPTTPSMYEVELLKVNDTNNYLNVFGSDFPKITTVNASISNNMLTVQSQIIYDGNDIVIEKGIVIGTDFNPVYGVNETYYSTDISYIFNTNVNNPAQNIWYHIRTFISTSLGITYSDDLCIYSAGVPLIKTVSVEKTSNIYNYTVYADIVNDGGKMIQESGFIVSDNDETLSIGMYDQIYTQSSSGSTGSFSTTITFPNQNSTYFVRSYAINSIGVGYGDVISITTRGVPIIKLNSVYNKDYFIYYTRIKTGGTVISPDCTVSECGLVWATHSLPTIDDNSNDYGSGEGYFDADLTNLNWSTNYYIRAYAINEWGIGYSYNEYEIKIADYYPEIIDPNIQLNQIMSVSNIDYNKIYIEGYIYDFGAPNMFECGFIWKEGIVNDLSLSNYTGKYTKSYPTNAGYSTILLGLSENVTYSFISYGINVRGVNKRTGYSKVKYFTVPKRTYPLIETVVPYDITIDSFTSGGFNIMPSSGAPIISNGIIYGKNPDLSIDNYDNIMLYGNVGISDFTVTIDELERNTKYYVRAIATNSYGTTYGKEYEFFTLQSGPKVETVRVERTSPTTVRGYGQITEQYGEVLKSCGIVYSSTVSNPLYGAVGCSNNNKLLYGDWRDYNLYYINQYSTGGMYIRAYAINEFNEIGYGDVMYIN